MLKAEAFKFSTVFSRRKEVRCSTGYIDHILHITGKNTTQSVVMVDNRGE